MSASRNTEYYGLSQWETNDRPSFVGDLNPDMEKIDEALHELQERLNTINFEGIRDELDSLKSDMSSLQIVATGDVKPFPTTAAVTE